MLDHNERTALHSATSTDLPQLVMRLLGHPDIDVNLTSKKGSTPVMEATKNGKLDSLKVRSFIIHFYEIHVDRFSWKMTVLT